MTIQPLRYAINSIVVIVLCLALVGCASIFSGGRKKVTINTTPPGAKVTIYDKSGKVVTTNQTPTVVQLDRGERYFKGQEYRIVIEKPGFKPAEVRITSNVNGWYFGNILIGGLIGMVIVDPMTGAMFTLSPDHIQETLTPAQRSSLKRGPGLGIMLKEQLSPEQIRNLKSLATRD
jgi:PEGA domain